MTQAELKTLMVYKDGKMYWCKPTSNRVKIGDEAGSKQSNNYFATRIHGKLWGIHQLVYLYHNNIEFTFDKVIDHIDRDKSNNKIENLRLVTRQQNNFNSSGTKGYTKRGDRFFARITLDQKIYHIGSYKTAEEATKAYETVKSVLHRYSKENASETAIREVIKKVRPSVASNNTSGFRGVRQRASGRWQAVVTENNLKKSLGHYATAEKAHAIRQKYLKH